MKLTYVEQILEYLAGDELKKAIATHPNAKLKGRFSYDESLSYEKNLISALKVIQAYPELKYELNLYNVSNIKSFFDLLKEWGINVKLNDGTVQNKPYKNLILNLWQIYIKIPETFIFTLYLDTVKCPENGLISVHKVKLWINDFKEKYNQNNNNPISMSDEDMQDIIEEFFIYIKHRAVVIIGRNNKV